MLSLIIPQQPARTIAELHEYMFAVLAYMFSCISECIWVSTLWLTDICHVIHLVAMIELRELEESQVSVESVRGWCVEEQAMEMDIAVLQQVEELERKVTAASLQVKVSWQQMHINTLPISFVSRVLNMLSGRMSEDLTADFFPRAGHFRTHSLSGKTWCTTNTSP